MINLVWGSSFKKACKRVVAASPYLKPKITQALEPLLIILITIL